MAEKKITPKAPEAKGSDKAAARVTKQETSAKLRKPRKFRKP
jgi:hypothetical protein